MKRTLADWAPMIGAVLASGLFRAYYLLLDMQTGSLAEMSREQGKILWGSSSLVLNLAMAWCALASLVVIHQFSTSFRRWQRTTIFLIFISLFSVLACFIFLSGKYAGSAADALLEKISANGLTGVATIVACNNAGGVLVAILLLLALVFVARGVEESSVRSLAERIRCFNLLLYSGGIVLAAAIYTTYWLFHWAASLEVVPLLRSSQETFASSVALGGGLLFSSLLMLIVVPAAIRLDRQLQLLMSRAAKTTTAFEPQKWLVNEGIGPAPLRSLTAGLAVLLPAATGLLTKIQGL
jgi:hypothetical protein